MRYAIIIFLGLALGCSPYYREPTDDTCASAKTLSQVAGDWTIEGYGSRTKCLEADEQRYSGDFVLGPSLPLNIEQKPSSTQTTVHSLALTTSLGSDFSFHGSVQGSCVNFETEEQTDDGLIRYTFTGQAEGSTRIEGKFSGTGPGSCRSSGDFTILIRAQ
jgi:hypothetical protein